MRNLSCIIIPGCTRKIEGMALRIMYPETTEIRGLDYWQNPSGTAIAIDPLRFLYVPDYAEHMMVSWLAKRVFDYQREHLAGGGAITKMVMITMGALLPGVLLHDCITYGAASDLPAIEFGTFGVRFYQGPGQPLSTPQVIQPLSIDVRGHIVGIIEDLADMGKTARYVRSVLIEQHGAKETILIAPYRKSASVLDDLTTLTFGVVPQDTWVITPRERVETMMKRVPFWAARGASAGDCQRYLREIGYPEYLIDAWFDEAWARVTP